LSAHKLYGPKGVGALYVRGVELQPILFGGGREQGRRPGAEYPASWASVQRPFRLDEMAAEAGALSLLRDDLWAGILRRVPDARLNGHPTRRLPGNLNVSFPGVPSHALLSALPGFALSAGSACHSGTTAPSEVLLAIGVPPELAVCSLRIGLGKETSPEQVQSLLSSLENGVLQARGPLEGN
jgi:cysteine desulfurase